MFVEQPDNAYVERMRKRHADMTARALVMIFQYGERDATGAVAKLMDQVKGPSRDRLVHEGPVNLAARIAHTPTTDLLKQPYAERIKRYNIEVRPFFEKEAQDDYDKNVRPGFEKRVHG